MSSQLLNVFGIIIATGDYTMYDMQAGRNFIKDTLRKLFDFRTTAQHRGVPAPPMEKSVHDEDLVIKLPALADCREVIIQPDLVSAMANRESVRQFRSTSLTVKELAFLLWSCQGIRPAKAPQPFHRTVPSAGARHSFNTYLLLNRIESMPKGLYRYQPLSHSLVFIGEVGNMEHRISAATLGQRFAATAAAVFVWATVPDRMEWRYGPTAHRVILLDAGHVCQNLYLACEAINCGTCAIGAYDQQAMDRLLGVDGEDEFVVYLAPVGKK